MIIANPDRTDTLIDALTTLWETSVRATHHFLTEDDKKCKTFHLCCAERGIQYCYQCGSFPCTKFKSFAKRWSKYGQDFIENQYLLQQIGETEFLKLYNQKVSNHDNNQ